MYLNNSFAKRYSAFVLSILIVMMSVLQPWAYIAVNRGAHTYADSEPYRGVFLQRMNCYGYAVHLYCYKRMGGGYTQYPGEFNDKGEQHKDLFASYVNAHKIWMNLFHFVHDRIIEDFNYLNNRFGEFSISETTFAAAVPLGKRKIALVIRQGIGDGAYHFYSRDNNGIWSHKNAHDPVTNRSFSTNVLITDSNFGIVSKEGGFDDGVRYYMIEKPYIIDYGHDNTGMYGSETCTPLITYDGAGASIDKSIVENGDQFAAFDYSGDVDCYSFRPTVSGTYRISTQSPFSADEDIILYDSDGIVIDSNMSSGHSTINHFLISGHQYFYRISEKNNRENPYMRYVQKI